MCVRACRLRELPCLASRERKLTIGFAVGGGGGIMGQRGRGTACSGGKGELAGVQKGAAGR